MEAPLSYLAQGTLQLGFSSEENFFSRKAHISSAGSMMERAASTGQTFEGSFEDLARSMSSSAKNSTSAGSRKRRPGSDLLRLGHASPVSWRGGTYRYASLDDFDLAICDEDRPGAVAQLRSRGITVL